MRHCAIILAALVFVACSTSAVVSKPTEEEARAYSAAAVTLSDFSMEIVAHYQSTRTSVPEDFDAGKFFAVLEDIYRDKARIRSIKDNYHVSVRPLDGGYSVMLCDPRTERKIMEDFSCTLTKVDVMSWESDVPVPCVFENDWKKYCEH